MEKSKQSEKENNPDDKPMDFIRIFDVKNLLQSVNKKLKKEATSPDQVPSVKGKLQICSLLSNVIQNKFLDKLEETEKEEEILRNNGVAPDEEIPEMAGMSQLS